MKKSLLKGMVAASLLLFGMPSYADGVKWLEKCLDESKIEISKGTTTIDGNVVKINGTGNQELKVTLKPGEDMTMNNGQTYVVIEANTTFDKTKKLDHLTVGSNKYVNKTGVLLGFNKDVNGHKLTVFNLLDKRGGNDADKAAVDGLIHFLCENAQYESSEASFYLQPSTALPNDADIEIYNIGFYTLGDILTEYPTLATQSWRFKKSQLCELESYSGDNNNTVKINTAEGTTTLGYNYLRGRCLQNMPSSYVKLDLRNMKLDASQNTPLKVDAFADLTFSDKILMTADQYKLFPTMNQYVAYPNANYTAYKDGVAPADIHVAQDGNKSEKGYSYTRNFKEGNNSCVLPFDVNVEDLLSLGLTAYTFASYGKETVNFKKADVTIPAGTPMMIQAEEAGLYMIPAASTPNVLSDIVGYKEAVDAEGNKFVGSFCKEVPTAYSNRYGLDATATSFMKMGEDVKTTYYRAFLSVAQPASEGKKLSMTFDGSTTDISLVVNGSTVMNDDAFYNMQGIQVNPNNLPRGIYIHHGKKIVIK